MKYFGFCAVSILAVCMLGCGGSGTTVVLTPEYADPLPIPGTMIGPDTVTPAGKLLGRSSNIPYLWDSVTSSPQVICNTANTNIWLDAKDSSHILGSFNSKPSLIAAPNGIPTYLNMPNGLTSGSAYGTNNNDLVVGYANGGANHIPVLWDSAHNPTVLDGANADARAITNSGKIYGLSFDSTMAHSDIAYWQTSGASMQIIPGTSQASLSFVNASTEMVGIMTSSGAAVITPGDHAVHNLKGGKAKILGISDSGVIVGYLMKDPSNQFIQTPVVWKDMSANPVEIGKLITTPAGWSIENTIGILPNGTIVVNAFNLSVTTAQSFYYVTPLP